MKPQHKYIEELIDTLQEHSPLVFPKKPAEKVPVAHGQHRIIQAILDIDWKTADTVLAWWCQGRRYDKACSVVDAPRYRVDGKVCGVVTAGQAEWHKGKLEEYYRRHAVGAAKYHQGSLVDYYESKFKPKSIIERAKEFLCLKWSQFDTVK